MTPADIATLKTRVEAALAESVKEFGGDKASKPRTTKLVMPLDRAWAMGNVDDTRALLTDNAVRSFGGTAFTVTVDDKGIEIAPVVATAVTPTPAPAQPSPAPPVTTPETPKA